MHEVYFYEAFAEEEEQLRRFLPSGVRAGFTWRTIQESGDATPPAPVVSIRTQSRIPSEWSGHLRGVLARATGYDHLLQYLRESGSHVAAGYLPLYCARAVAEHAALLWMSLLRKLPLQIEQFRRFQRDGITGRECARRRLLVVGVGNIGSEVVRIGQGLDMDVHGVDIVRKYDFVRYTTIEMGLPRAEVLVCAMNLTPRNAGYFDYARLRQVPAGAIFVNVARGEHAPAADLLRLVEEGHLGGVGLDVFEDEADLAVALRQGRECDDPTARATLALSKKPNVILTPHNAFNTVEAVERKAKQSVEQILHLFQHGRFLWPVPEKPDGE